MKKLAALLLFLLCLGAAPAHATCTAPCTKAQLATDIAASWPDNTTAAITPALLRSRVLDIVNSYFDGGGSAVLACAANQWAVGFATLSTLNCAQPAFSQITGQVTLAQFPTTTATRLVGNPTGSPAVPSEISLGQGVNFLTSAKIQVEPASARFWPASGQSSTTTVPWQAVDPWGNPITTVTPTNSQGYNEFLAAAQSNGWSTAVMGPGTINSSVQIVDPPCFSRHMFIDTSVTFNWSVSLGATDNMVIDSTENCYRIYRGQVGQHSGDTGAAVRLKPTNAGGHNIIVAASTLEFFTAIAPATGGTGLIWDLANGGIIGNTLIWNDINGGATGLQVTNPGSGVIAFEHNRIMPGYIHGQTTRVMQVGTAVTNQANMRYNTWNPIRIDPGAGATAGVDSWETFATYTGLNVTNETNNATTGLVLESGACNNTFIGGSVLATTALSDSCANSGGGTTTNTFIDVRNIPNNYLRQIIPLSSAAQALAQASTGFELTFLAPGEGAVEAVCPVPGTFRNLRVLSSAPAAGQTLTLTWRKNNADTTITCVITGTGTTCNDVTHTASCVAGDAFDLKAVTSATTGSISFIAGGIEFDGP